MIYVLGEIVILALIFTVFAIRTSWFQTWLAQQASTYFSKEFGTEVSIGKVDIKFFNEVDIIDVYIEDIKKDTFLYTKVIHADIDDWSLDESFVTVSNATLDEGHIHIRKYKGDSTLNFQHIIDYFATEEEDTTSSDFSVNVSKIGLDDIHFIYQDQNVDTIENGMDFSNIELKHLRGDFSHFNMKGEDIGIHLDDLSFVDRSGLALNKLSGELLVGAQEISLKNLIIGINNTIIQGDYLTLITPNGGEDWADFVHKVNINAHLKNSKLYLSDLAYFVPDLWGVKGDVNINNLETRGAVYGMQLNNLDLQILDTTRLIGNFNIPNLDDINSAFFQEELSLFRTSISDVEALHLERILDEDGAKTLKKTLAQYATADVIELKKGSMIGGIESFVVDGDLFSGIGDVYLENGLKFEWNEDEQLYYYSGSTLNKGEIKIDNLNIGVIAGNKIVDRLNGTIFVKGKGFDEKSLDLTFNGALNRVGIYGYDYHDIDVYNGRFARNIFSGKVTVGDDNLALLYEGKVGLKAPMFFDFDVRIDSAQVATLSGKDKRIYQKLAASVSVNIQGTDVNKLTGTVLVKDFEYKDSAYNIAMDQLSLNVTRNPLNDSIVLKSPFLKLELYGKYNLHNVAHAITDQFSYVVSNLIEGTGKEEEQIENEHFELIVTLKDINPLLKFYDESMMVAPYTMIRSEYADSIKSFVFDINSDSLVLAGLRFEEIKIENHMDSTKAMLSYHADRIQLNDSLAVRDFQFDSKISDNKFGTLTGWAGEGITEPALFAFESEVKENQDILTVFRPSFFFLKGHRYIVEESSTVLYNTDKIQFTDFKIANKENYIGLEGLISKKPDDWLHVTIHDFDLSDLNGMLGETIELQGLLNMEGKLANLYDQPKFDAVSNVKELTLDGYLVGDINLGSTYNELNKSITANGELLRENKKTFSFAGDYYLDREKDNLNFIALFENTDIAFLNAFDDPELYTDIEGILDGKIKITGEADNPKVTGKMEIVQSNVMVPMFNVAFGAAGIIKLNDGEIIADHLRINDQEYNMADCQMQVYHYDWENWNYNILLDMDNPTMSNRFLAMDTYYKEGDSYYGRAYVSGMVSIYGYDEKTEIEVDVTTEKGTDLVLPMYGSGELEEGSFIVFDETFFLPDSLKDIIKNEDVKKVERTGLELGMKFNVTKDARLKIVFDPLLEDQIICTGEGNLEINLDEYNDMTMFGEYVIRDGRYEMRIKQVVEEDFMIKNGSIVQWSGPSEDAQINIEALFERVVSLEDIIPPEASERRKKEQVLGILRMTNTLMNPELEFDIRAPKTDDFGQKALNQIKADQDELNKQFFALLVLKRFLPRYGGGAGGGNALLGLAETQINSVLSGISENYALKAGLTESQTTIGVETQLNDRTTIKTSFGVLSDDTGAGGGQLVGDVDIEYRLNEDGTFTMNFFNETNSSSITAQGNYTQGISLHYQETFNTTKEFRLWQKFLNIFRKKENRIKFEKKSRKSDKWVPIPDDSDTTTTGLIFTE